MKQLVTVLIAIILLHSQNLNAQSWSLTGNSGTNPSTQFLGTTDNKALKLRTNNNVRLTISSAGKVGIGTSSPAFKLDVKGGSINTDSVYRIGGLTALSVKGSSNTFVGIHSGDSLTTGFDNTAIGYLTLSKSTSANYNTACGYTALTNNRSGNNNSAIGAFALSSNVSGFNNTAQGYGALFNNVDGSLNTATGFYALESNTSGNNNAAYGNQALYSNTTGNDNAAFGTDALLFNATGENNTATGYSALVSNTAGVYNTANGFDALYNNNGNYNTGIGGYALETTTGSSYNTAVGYAAGDSHNNGSLNVFVGEESDATVSGLSNVVAVGQGTLVGASNIARFGNSGTTSYGGYANWTNISDGRYKKNIKENVPGLEFINKLRPVTYNLDASGLDAFLHKNNKVELSAEAKSVYEKALTEKEKIINTGFIAQEVQAAAKEIGYDFSGVDAAKNENDVYGLRYAEFVVPLVKAVQELSQQNMDLKKEVEELKSSIVNRQSSMSDGDLKFEISDSKFQTPLLGQNIPNPFNNTTLIPFSIPKNCNGGSIIITNTSTSQVISVIPISCNEDHVSVDAGMLVSGAYSYTLFVDGKLIDKKEMLITK